jgi:hypothetical protein
MYSFLNGSPRATLQLMSAETTVGRTEDALHSFAQFVAMGQADKDALEAKSFDPLRGLPAYQSLYAGMAANGPITSTATEAFRLGSSVLIPEDIDYDPAAKRFYISTVLANSGHKSRLAPACPLGNGSGIGWLCSRRQGGLG